MQRAVPPEACQPKSFLILATGTETDKGGGTIDFCLDDAAINVS